MKNISNQQTQNNMIHKILRHIYRVIGQDSFTLPLAQALYRGDILESAFMKHFQTKENFLQLTIDRMLQLFSEVVAKPVEARPINNKDKVFFFLRCVEEYFANYPEAGYLFTMTFFSDIATSDIYYALERYYNVWEKTLYNCLLPITSPVLARRLSDIYFISLKGQLQLADCELIPRNSYHAEAFLTQALFNLH